MGILSSIGKGIAKTLDVVATTVANPIKVTTAVLSPTKTYKEVEDKFFAQSTSKQLATLAISTAGIAATVVGAGAVSAAAKAGTLGASTLNVAKSLIPKSTTGKIAVAAAAPVAIGAVAGHPVESAKAAVNLPSNLANVGANLAVLGSDPSLENLKTLVKENPIIVGGAAAAVAAPVLISGSKLVSDYMTREAIREDLAGTSTPEQYASREFTTQPIQVIDKSGEFTKLPVQSSPVVSTTPITPQSSPVVSTTPITPQTSTLAKSGSEGKVRRRKRKSQRSLPSVSQKVNVIVQNKNTSVGIRATKKYINRELLA